MTTRWFLPVPPPDPDDDLARFAAACDWLDGQLALGDAAVTASAPPDTSPVLAAIAEPQGLPGDSLPAYGVPGNGCCRECLRPPVHSQGLCVYCATLERARGEADTCRHGLEKALCRSPGRRDRGRGRAVVLVALLCLAWVALCWATGMIR